MAVFYNTTWVVRKELDVVHPSVRQRWSRNLVCLEGSRCKTSTLPSTRWIVDKTHNQACTPSYDMSFAAAYRLAQLRQLTENNVVGPRWLGDPNLLDLLLSYATLPKAFIPWHSLENAWGSKTVPVSLLKTPKKGCKARLKNAHWHNTAQLGFQRVVFQTLVRWWLKLRTKN